MSNKATQTPPKMNYIALLQQDGEGCDHTIACGTHFVPLKATTPDEAIAESKTLLAEYRGERSLRSMYIFETTRSLKVPVAEVYRELDAKDADEAAARAAAEEEAQARAQYEQLHARFGSGK
jgi:hypothetical protein